MSNTSFIIEERAANIGDFFIGRMLPFRQKKSVGPFVFIDHIGPERSKDFENLDIPSHPHIGLSAMTYLFEGAIFHKDSIGNEVEIFPGAVSWLTAGKGVVHSERTPEYLRDKEKTLRGLQVWVALPKDLEDSVPSYILIEANELPMMKMGTATVKVIAGEIFGMKSPVPIHSKLFMFEIKSTSSQQINIGEELRGESGLYILEGSIKSKDFKYEAKQILIAKGSSLSEFEMLANSTVYIFGGEPFPEERFTDWNFVSASKGKLIQAKKNWDNQVFPVVPGETGFVSYPQKM